MSARLPVPGNIRSNGTGGITIVGFGGGTAPLANTGVALALPMPFNPLAAAHHYHRHRRRQWADRASIMA
jgi:hypothetical protein